MEKTLYLRLRHRIQASPNEVITIGKIAQVVGNREWAEQVKKIIVRHVNSSDKNIVVLDVMAVVNEIHKLDEEINVQTIGPSQTIIEVVYEKKKISPFLFGVVWLLLFVGSGLAIMNFHEDVSMQQVHTRIYKMITGEVNEQPLLLQIPYSIGLGLGMILFFNHLFKKRFNEEPSPLEVEMFNYQMDLDHYVAMNENEESMKKIDDD
ncbi:stage V sporulation protein AA [Metabacillus fastidiosus]|uniref:stage V sporulation protein AA n=1 Tax=Metabacillus fastidiosus TaxID=1458 RepID=UPI002DB61B0C|nr:stage V sporulation protein AA [Metabacillus fastidiosus]MEC2075760.1 stage V sporulation protein AA [Metabacillus fastidiosus]